MTTTNVEKLVYNIFERKNWIIEQVKQQTYLYERQLASNLLIQGINPPPWFLNPNLHSISSDPKELNKEELISDLLFPHAIPTFPYSTGQRYLQNRLVGTGDNGKLLDILPNDKDPDAGDEPRLELKSHSNDAGCISYCVPGPSYAHSHDQADVGVTNILINSGQSPGRSQRSQLVLTQDGEKASDGSHTVVGTSNKGLDGGYEPMNLPDSHDTNPGCIFNSVPKCSSAEQTEVRISNIDIAPDQSLARLQRSKSRQKALELRTSGKATKSRLSDENKRISFGGVAGVALYGIDPEELQVNHAEDGSEVVLPSDLHKASYLDMHQPNCHLTEGFAEQRIDEGNFFCETTSEIVPPNSQQQCYGSSAVPSLNKMVTRDPKSFLDEEVNMKNEPDDVLDARQRCSVDDENNLRQHKHSFDCESTDTLASTEKMSLEDGSDNLAEEGLNTSTSVGDPQNEDNNFSPLEFGEAQPTFTSSLPKKKFMHTKFDSWPQFKRRKIEYQQTNCFSASASLREQKLHNMQEAQTSSHSKTVENELDAIPKLLAFSSARERNGSESSDMFLEKMECHLTDGTFSSPILERQQEGNFFCETTSEIVPPNYQQQCYGSSVVPSLNKMVTRDPKSFLDEEVNMKNEPDDVLDARQRCSVDDENNLRQHKHSFDCESTDTLASTEKMSLEDGSDNLAEEGLNTSTSVGDPQNEDNNSSPVEFGEAQPTFTSSLPKKKFMHTKFDSWPQFKRRKIEYQQTNCFSASASLREQKLHNMQEAQTSSHSKTVENELDAIPKLLAFSSARERNDSESSDMFLEKMECHLTDGTFSSPILERQQEDGKFCFTEQIMVVQTPSTSEHEELGPCFVSRLSKQATNETQGSFVENDNTSYHPTDILSAACDEQEFQKIFHVGNAGDLADTDILTSSRSALLDSDPHPKDDGFVSRLSKQAINETQGSFVENDNTSYHPTDILSAACDEQEFQKIFHVGNAGDLADTDILTSSSSALLDSDPHPKDDGPVGSPCNIELAFDQDLPVYEGFVLDEHSDIGGLNSSRDEINFSELNTTCNSMQRASILEQICRNASMCTPLVHFSSTYKPLRNKDLYLSVPNRLLEHTDLTSTLSFSEDAGNHLQATSTDEVDSTLQEMLYSDSLPYSGAQYSWNAKYCDTPVGRYCKRTSSSSINSEKRLSSNPELTCFRIEEDSCVVDEHENADDNDDHVQEDIGLAETNSCMKGEPLSETIEVFSNPPAAKKLREIGGIDSSNAEIQCSVKQRLRNPCSNNKSKNWGKENQLSSMGENSIKVGESLHNRFSKAKLSSTTSIKRGTQRLSEKVKRNNIVSNVTSFIPLVQQKQAAAVCKGKRDIKVRALEAAEAAKRQEEKKENERKIKKEALKLERAKIEQETLKQRELDKRKKEEELKKKDADLAARKRMREEEGRKEKERKRKRIGVGWQTHIAQEGKTFAGKGEKEKQCGNMGKSTNIRKESDNRTGKGQHGDKVSRGGNTLKKPESQTEFKTTRSYIQEVSAVPEICETLGNCDGSIESTGMLDQLSSKSGIGTNTTREKSYEMSPYQHSDDEEEEEDEVPAKKFIPSWASKNCVALVLASQQQIDPSVIFPRESFCSMNEALLPRHLQ